MFFRPEKGWVATRLPILNLSGKSIGTKMVFISKHEAVCPIADKNGKTVNWMVKLNTEEEYKLRNEGA